MNTSNLANFTEQNNRKFSFYAANGLYISAGDCVIVNESFLILKRIVCNISEKTDVNWMNKKI